MHHAVLGHGRLSVTATARYSAGMLMKFMSESALL